MAIAIGIVLVLFVYNTFPACLAVAAPGLVWWLLRDEEGVVAEFTSAFVGSIAVGALLICIPLFVANTVGFFDGRLLDAYEVWLDAFSETLKKWESPGLAIVILLTIGAWLGSFVVRVRLVTGLSTVRDLLTRAVIALTVATSFGFVAKVPATARPEVDGKAIASRFDVALQNHLSADVKLRSAEQLREQVTSLDDAHRHAYRTFFDALDREAGPPRIEIGLSGRGDQISYKPRDAAKRVASSQGARDGSLGSAPASIVFSGDEQGFSWLAEATSRANALKARIFAVGSVARDERVRALRDLGVMATNEERAAKSTSVRGNEAIEALGSVLAELLVPEARDLIQAYVFGLLGQVGEHVAKKVLERGSQEIHFGLSTHWPSLDIHSKDIRWSLPSLRSGNRTSTSEDARIRAQMEEIAQAVKEQFGKSKDVIIAEEAKKIADVRAFDAKKERENKERHGR